MEKPQKNYLFTILLTVLIDMIGVGIIIPVIPALFFEESATFFDAAVDNDYRSVVYGLLLACYPFMQFFGAPMLGTMSDRYGRKPMLMISLIGTLLGYLLFAYAISIQNLYLLFFSRMLPGFMGGNIAIIYSAIADKSSAADKAKNFGMVGAAFGVGFIIGPALGGYLADSSVVSWFNHSTPFWFTAMLTFLNILLVQFFFSETIREKRKDAQINFLKGVSNIVTSFVDKQLRTIFTVVLLVSLGFTFFTQFFSVLLFQQFDYTEKDVGLYFGWVGIWIVFTQAVVVRKASGMIAPTAILKYSIIGIAITVGISLLPAQSFWFYIIAPFMALSQGLTSPNLVTVVSEQAGSDKQGEILGINQSMNSLGHMIPPVVAGYLNTLNHNFPLLAGTIIIFLAWLIFIFVFLPGIKKSS